MTSTLARSRHKIPYWLGNKATTSVCLFSCFYLLTLFFSDNLGLTLLSYVAGSLALLTVFRFGGPRTAIGFLLTLFVARYYFVPLFVKAVEGDPIWDNLYSPEQTLLVLVCSLITMLIVSVFYHERKLIPEKVNTPSGSKHLHRLIIVTAFIGITGTLQTVAKQQVGESAQFSGGGFLGGAGDLFQVFLAFSLSLAIYRALARHESVLRSRSVMLLLTINALSVFIAVSRGSVLAIPIAIVVPYLLTGRRITVHQLGTALIGLLLFAFVVNPAITYLRDPDLGDVEFYSLGQRIDNMANFWIRTLTDPDYFVRYKERMSEQEHYLHYFEHNYGGLERFALLPDSDKLINATTVTNQFGGWRTISWALSMVPPRFIYPNKPFLGPGAYLGYVAGFTTVYNTETQWVVGFPAEFYHAFSYVGVFLGTAAVMNLFFLVLKIFELLKISELWKMLVALYYWDYFSEAHLAALLYTLVPLIILIIIVDLVVRYSRRWRFVIN